MLLVEKAEISFSSGLNVFTGETGAGKSIILDCLGFVLGNKSRNRFLRDSCDSGEVVAEFIVKEHSPVRDIFNQLSIKLVDTLVIRRVEFSDGKRKTYLNDTSCTLETIQKIGAELIEFVDQKEGSLVLKKSNHINLLDDFSGHKPKVASLQSIWKNIKAINVEIASLITKKDSLKEELDFIKYSLSELKNLAPKPGEIENLEVMKNTLKSSCKINENLQYASNILSGGERRSELVAALNKLERASDLLPSNDSLTAVIGSLEGIIHELEEIGKNIQTILEKQNFEEMNLEDVEERLFKLRQMARKHGINPEDLMTLNEGFERSLAEYNDSEAQMDDLKGKFLGFEKEYQEIAREISERRKLGGKNLDIMMRQELRPLRMEGIVFSTLLGEKKEKGASGFDNVTFQVCNSGMQPKDLDKIASGGELSRLLLALKVCLITNAKGVSLVFDEIDRGVGGATAEAVGNRLATLAESDQVLLVTHSPQVASKANKHWTVRKLTSEKKIPVTLLDELNQDTRVIELARMISGEVISKEALAAANKLIG